MSLVNDLQPRHGFIFRQGGQVLSNEFIYFFD
jgi:hypothetical protein